MKFCGFIFSRLYNCLRKVSDAARLFIMSNQSVLVSYIKLTSTDLKK